PTFSISGQPLWHTHSCVYSWAGSRIERNERRICRTGARFLAPVSGWESFRARQVPKTEHLSYGLSRVPCPHSCEHGWHVSTRVWPRQFRKSPSMGDADHEKHARVRAPQELPVHSRLGGTSQSWDLSFGRSLRLRTGSKTACPTDFRECRVDTPARVGTSAEAAHRNN